jgi:hypothetical protein
MDEIAALAQVLDIAGNLSVVGLLLTSVWAFSTGRIVPKSVMDRMLEEASNRTNKVVRELIATMKAEIYHAVRDGVRDGREKQS